METAESNTNNELIVEELKRIADALIQINLELTTIKNRIGRNSNESREYYPPHTTWG